MQLRTRVAIALLFVMARIGHAAPSDQKIHISWVMHNDSEFWHLSQKIAEQAAKDFGISITIHFDSTHDRSSMANITEEILRTLVKSPDTTYYLVTVGSFYPPERIIDLATEKKVPMLVFNSPLTVPMTPRKGQQKGLIGALIPNDQEAGYLQAKALLAEDQRRNPANGAHPQHIVAFGGWGRDTVDALRQSGLRRAAREAGAIVDQYFYTGWSRDVAKDQMARAHKRYPDTRVFWTAADYLGLAIASRTSASSRDLIGGIDWSPEGVDAVLHGSGLFLSVGGHFFDPGWVTALIYDYHHGLDFAQVAPNYIISTRMAILTKESAKKLVSRFPNFDFSSIDFKRYSRVYTKLSSYDFSANSLNL